MLHGWCAAGNRVTVRDWYQLTLKEGLTRFRDQAFAADYDEAASAAAATCGTLNSSSSGPHQQQYEAALLQNIATMAQQMKTAAAEAAAAPAAVTTAPAPAPAAAAAGTTGAVSGPAFPCSWHRVLEAQGIRCDQMPEDEGSLSHPIRPCCGTSLDNLYTDTVYNKVRGSSSRNSSSSAGDGMVNHQQAGRTYSHTVVYDLKVCKQARCIIEVRRL